MTQARLNLQLVVSLVALVLIFTACSPGGQSGGGDKNGSGPVIQLIGADGQAKDVTVTEMSEMGVFEGLGSFKKSTGAIEGPYNCKGIKMFDLIAGAGATASSGVEVVAADGYAMTYTAEQIAGDVMTYDSEGNALRLGGTTMTLAYEIDEKQDFEGSPRVVFLAGENVITDGHFWARDVKTIRVLPEVKDWSISLAGIEEASMDRATYESVATCPDTRHPALTWEYTDKEGQSHTYEGVPLWVLLSMVDGADPIFGHYRFNDDLAREGYVVKIISRDGYSVELESQLVARNSKILAAYKKNGDYLPEDEFPLILVGEDLPSKKYMLKQIDKIELDKLSE